MSLTESIKLAALRLGFDLVGVTTAEPISEEEQAYLQSWLSRDCAGGLSWMRRNREKRTSPAALLAGAKSVICTATAYGPLPPESHTSTAAEPLGRIADYAACDDYHNFIKDKLFALADSIAGLVCGTPPRFKVCVDSAPLAERSLARRAGLGFIGRNHMLTSAKFGSQLFLGEIITDLALQPDPPAAPAPCADCDRCIKACPTAALRPHGGFESARCISYLTIEHKGQIEPSLAKLVGNRLFGCDECQLACPLTQAAAVPAANPQPRRPRLLPLNQVISWRREQFMACFHNSPVERLGLEGLKRNARICLANAGQGKNASSGSQGASCP